MEITESELIAETPTARETLDSLHALGVGFEIDDFGARLPLARLPAAAAEGIETADELRFLRDLGCDRSQGFCFAPQLPAEECTALPRAGDRWPATGDRPT